MSTPPTSARPAKSRGAVPKDKNRAEQGSARAEIVRMAAVAAATRAAEQREQIATAAYFRAQKRGFEPGHELEDWLAAETDIFHAQQLDTF